MVTLEGEQTRRGQCLNKIREMLLREIVEFINFTHLTLFDIIICLQPSPRVNLL